MAERRMFCKGVIDTDLFLDMPLSTQSLYFHLGMRADDEGFIGNPKKIKTMIGASDDDLKVLIAKNFVIPFESGVMVIRHWKQNNYLQKDRIKSTVFLDEKAQLTIDKDSTYCRCIHSVYNLDTKCIHSIDKNSIDKISLEEVSKKESKDINLIEETNACVREDKLKSYDEILDEYQADGFLTDFSRAKVLEFIKYLVANKYTLLNSRLEHLIIQLELKCAGDDTEKARVIDKAIRLGYKALEVEND